MSRSQQYSVFRGERLMVKGSLEQIKLSLKEATDHSDKATILVFDATDGRQLDIDLSAGTGDSAAVSDSRSDAAGTESTVPAGKPRGRPKLGVVGREITLLPRHWEWLDGQRNGASAALRKLVDQARKAEAGEQEVRLAQDSANRFMYAMAGNLQGFEEAVRALYARDKSRFEAETAPWPVDIRNCAREYAEMALI